MLPRIAIVPTAFHRLTQSIPHHCVANVTTLILQRDRGPKRLGPCSGFSIVKHRTEHEL